MPASCAYPSAMNPAPASCRVADEADRGVPQRVEDLEEALAGNGERVPDAGALERRHERPTRSDTCHQPEMVDAGPRHALRPRRITVPDRPAEMDGAV